MDKTRKEILTRYKSGESSVDLQKAYRLCRATILKIVRVEGDGAVRSRSEAFRKYSVNETAFDAPLGEEALYWIGFLLADGTVEGNRKHNAAARIRLKLAKKDKKHLRLFLDFLKSSYPISPTRAGCNTVQLLSDKLYRRLRELGITERKSFTAAPSAEVVNSRHFWRGMVDGDGYPATSKNTAVMELCGSLASCTTFVNFLADNNIYGQVGPHGSIHDVLLCGDRARNATALLYKDCVIALPRKFKIAERIMKQPLTGIVRAKATVAGVA